MNDYDTIVIGAGHNGLTAAAYLAQAGRRVIVLERSDRIGGAAATEQVFRGFAVDTGAHKLQAFDAAVISDLGLESHGLEFIESDPCVVALNPNGVPLVLRNDPTRTASELRNHSERDAAVWSDFATLIGNAASILAAAWESPPPRLTESDYGDLWASLKLGMKLKRLGKRDMVEVMRILPMSMAEMSNDWFENDLLQGTLAAAAVAGMYQGPMGAGTAYNFLHQHVGAKPGSIRPSVRVRGGIQKLSKALFECGRGHGAELRTEATVAQILVNDGKAVGVRLSDGEELRANRVLSSADPAKTFLELLDPMDLGPDFVTKVRNIRFKGASAKVHFALDALPEFRGVDSVELLRGLISIAPSLEYVERAYDDAKYGRVSERPVVELSIPSVTDSSVAPEGLHLMSAWVHYAPYSLSEGKWNDAARDKLGVDVEHLIGEYAPNMKSIVRERHVLTPSDLEARFCLTEGNANHGEMTLDQLLFMRPVPGYSRYDTPVENLFMCGAGSHPGGGVLGVCGRNAAREVLGGRGA